MLSLHAPVCNAPCVHYVAHFCIVAGSASSNAGTPSVTALPGSRPYARVRDHRPQRAAWRTSSGRRGLRWVVRRHAFRCGSLAVLCSRQRSGHGGRGDEYAGSAPLSFGHRTVCGPCAGQMCTAYAPPVRDTRFGDTALTRVWASCAVAADVDCDLRSQLQFVYGMAHRSLMHFVLYCCCELRSQFTLSMSSLIATSGRSLLCFTC